VRADVPSAASNEPSHALILARNAFPNYHSKSCYDTTMELKSSLRNPSGLFFAEKNSKINLAITLVVFALLTAKLIHGGRLAPVIAMATVLLLVLTIYFGSITQTVIIGFVSCLSTAVFVSVLKQFSYLLLNPIPFLILFLLVFIIVATLFKHSVALEVPWKSEILSVLLAFFSLSLIWNSRLAVSGGPVAALYGSEDNAAWILSIHRVIQNDIFSRGGDFGSLLDSMLLISYHLGNFVFPTLTAVDHLALSAVLLQIIIVFLIPFLPNLIKLGSTSTKSTLVSSLVLSSILSISFRTFNQYGHLTAAISCTLISLYLVSGFQLSGEMDNQKLRYFLAYLQISVAYLAGVTWFPVAPLAILLILFALWRVFCISEVSRLVRLSFSSFALVLIGLLTFEDLIKRFSTFKTPDEGIFSGAKNLLSFEGGVVSNDPWSLSLIIVFALIVMTIMVFLRINTNLYFGELGLLVVFVMSLTLISTVLFSGNVTYGARKVTVLIILCSAALLSWALVALVESHLRDYITPLLPGVFVLAMILAMPGAGAFAGGKYFAGFEREDHFKHAKQLASNIEIGRSTVCIFEANVNQDPGALSSYMCSRWAAAYSFREGVEFNGWRKAVLGQIQNEDLSKVRQDLPYDTMLIVIGPENPSTEKNNDNWATLIDEKWTIVR